MGELISFLIRFVAFGALLVTGAFICWLMWCAKLRRKYG